MALWKISDVWMEVVGARRLLERAGISNELALAVNPALVIVRVSTYGQFGKEDYLGRPGYDALAQAFGGMMNVTGDPGGPPQRAKTLHRRLPDRADRLGLDDDGAVGGQKTGGDSHRPRPI